MRSLYLAEGVGCIKIGISVCVPARMLNLSRGVGGPFRLVQVWTHDHADRVEAVCKRLLSARRIYGHEYFSASVDEGRNAVEAALERYAAGDYPRINEGLKIQLDAFWVSVRIVFDRFNEMVRDGVDVDKPDPTFPRLAPFPTSCARSTHARMGQPPKVHKDNYRAIEAAIAAGERVGDIAKRYGMSEGCLRTWYPRARLDEIREHGIRPSPPKQKRQETQQ